MIPQQPQQAAQPQTAQQQQRPTLRRPLIASSTPEDVNQEITILQKNVDEFFFGRGAEDRMRRIAQEMADNAENLPVHVGQRSADLMQELIRNATISGHRVNKMAIVMTMKHIVESFFEIAANIGAWQPNDDNEMQRLQVQALLVALREFFMNAPEGYKLTPQELRQFLLEAGAEGTAPQAAGA